MWLNYIFLSIYWWLRPLIKWFLRRSTKLCELQRICYGEPKGAQRTLKIEYSLDNTRNSELQKVIKILRSRASDGTLTQDLINYAIFAIVRIKHIDVKIHKQFPHLLTDCCMQIMGYHALLAQLENLRQQHYDSDNAEHEEKLKRFWGFLQPDVPLLSRVGKHWQEIGFQGDDPKTDFRGMGILGLENLLFFAENHTNAAHHVFSRSQHPVYGYSFAIVGINITHLAYNLVKEGRAKTHFFNSHRLRPNLESFQHFFSYLFFEFDILWRREKPKDIMEFSRVRTKFEKSISSALAGSSAYLRCNFVLENV